MSSPLENRMRAIAREEAANALATAAAPGADAAAAPGLQQQITDLHEHLHHVTTINSRLEARLTALEKAAGQTDPQAPAVRRTRRKAESE